MIIKPIISYGCLLSTKLFFLDNIDKHEKIKVMKIKKSKYFQVCENFLIYGNAKFSDVNYIIITHVPTRNTVILPLSKWQSGLNVSVLLSTRTELI